MNAAQWYARADIWQDRLTRLEPRLRPNVERNNRIHNRLFRGIQHALQMGAISRRVESGHVYE